MLIDSHDGQIVRRYHARRSERILPLISLSPDDKLLAGCATEKDSSPVLFWNTRTGPIVRVLAPQFRGVATPVFSPDGKLLACVQLEGVALYDTRRFERYLFVRGDFPTEVAFSPDSRILAVHAYHTGLTRLWNIATNRELAVLSCPEEPGLAFTNDGRFLVAYGPHSMRVWDVAGAGERLVLGGHRGGVTDIIFSPDGQLLLSASKDNQIRIWDAHTGALQRTLTDFHTPVQTLAFTPDGKVLAAGDFETGTIRFYDVVTWKPFYSVRSEIGAIVYSIAFSPDGRYFAAAGSNGCRPWRIRQGGEKPGVASAFSLEGLAQISNGYCLTLCVSPDSRLLAWVQMERTANQMVNAIHAWDIAAGRPIGAPASQVYAGVLALKFLPHSERVVFVSDKPAVEIWDLATGQQESASGGSELKERGVLPPHMALTHDGAWLAMADRNVAVWDLAAGKLLLALPGETSAAWCAAFSPDRKQLAVGTSDGGLVVWNLAKVNEELTRIGLGW